METVTISPKFQVVIPKAIRTRLKLKAGQKVQALIYQDRISIWIKCRFDAKRAASLRKLPPLPTTNYEKLFKINAPDVSARDNNMLANSATGIAHAMQQLEQMLQGNTNEEFKRLATDSVHTCAG